MAPPLPAVKLPLPPRGLGPGAIAAILIHVLVIGALLWERSSYLERTMGDRGLRGGGGTGAVAARYFNLPSSDAPAAVPPPPTPVPVPVPEVKPAVKPLEIPRIAINPPTVTIVPPVVGAGGGGSPGSGGGVGGGAGTGTGTSTGPGKGGEGGDILPADPRSVLLPPDCARGQFTVRFWVEVDGRVSRVEVEPLPKESDCRRELLTKMRGYQFRPATTRDGRPIASVYPVTFN